MNIKNVNPGSNLSPDQLRPDQTDEVRQAEQASSSETSSDATARSAEDRVEISDAGRAAQANGPDIDPAELESARQAMLDIPPLSADRAEDIFKRIQAGYYSQPDAIKSIAEGIASEMTGQPPEIDASGASETGTSQAGPSESGFAPDAPDA